MTEADKPVVLAVDDNEQLLDTYRMWLADDYDLRTAAGGEAALSALDEEVQVVLLDRLMGDLTGEEVLTRIREQGYDCQVAMVTAVEPDFDITELPFDAYVPKAVDRETVTSTVERLITRGNYDDTLRKHYALAETLATIESQKTAAELADSEEYQRLTEEFERLDEALTERGNELRREEIVGTIESGGVAAGTTREDDS